MGAANLPVPTVIWLVTEDVRLIRADTITGIDITSEEVAVWQRERVATVVKVADRPRLSTNFAGYLAQCMASAMSDPPCDSDGKPYPVVFVWLYVDNDPVAPTWQVGVQGMDSYTDPPEPPFCARVPNVND